MLARAAEDRSVQAQSRNRALEATMQEAQAKLDRKNSEAEATNAELKKTVATNVQLEAKVAFTERTLQTLQEVSQQQGPQPQQYAQQQQYQQQWPQQPQQHYQQQQQQQHQSHITAAE